MAKYSLLFLGTPQIKLTQKNLILERQKSLALLAYLAVNDSPASRNQLGVMLWPEAPTSQALTSLRAVLVDLRKTLGDQFLMTTHQTIGLTREAYGCDVTHFRTLLAASHSHCPSVNHPICSSCVERLDEAVKLVRGDFLSGFHLRDETPFEEWQNQQNIQLRREYHLAIEKLAVAYTQQGDYLPAIQSVSQWLSSDPLEEKAHGYLMQLYALNGQRGLALRQYEACKEMLARELDVRPHEETTTILKTILNGQPLSYLSHNKGLTNSVKYSEF